LLDLSQAHPGKERCNAGAMAVSGVDSVLFLIDDNGSVRETIRCLLESAELRVETFANAEECSDGPARLVRDVRLPGMSGADLLRELQRTGRPLPTIVITGHGDVPMFVGAMRAGAIGFVLKPLRAEELLDAIHQALSEAAVARRQRRELADLKRRYASLTPREREVMAGVVCGRLNKQIAGKLGTSQATIKMHRAHVMRKMQVRSVAELARIGERLGL